MKFFYASLLIIATAAAGYLVVNSALVAGDGDTTLLDPLPPFEAEVPLPQSGQGTPVVFKWQDKQGAWHYADAPPADPDVQSLLVSPGTTGASAPPARHSQKPASRL